MAVKVNIRIMEDIKRLIDDPTFKDRLGQMVVKEMKDEISKGLSPVRNFGRFKEYAAVARSRTGKSGKNQGYPYSVMNKFSDKKVRPVNLYLSGDMLQALTFKKTRDGITVGIFNSEQSEKAQKHQLGDSDKNLAKRRFLPSAKGEMFTVTLTRMIRDLYSDALSAILRRK